MKLKMLQYIREGKEKLQRMSSFFEDEEARGLYVVLLTAEGALMFGDVKEFGQHCVEFAERKKKEAEGGGNPGPVSLLSSSGQGLDPNP